MPNKPALVRANYDGFVLFKKTLLRVFGDNGFVSYGSLVTPPQLLKIRTQLSLMRLDALRLGSRDAASRIKQFSGRLMIASDGQSRAIAVVLDNPKDPKHSVMAEQEFFKHIKDYELSKAVGETLFDDFEFKEIVAYQKARKTVEEYGYPQRHIFRKVLGKLARNDASGTLNVSSDEVNELRKVFRRKILNLGLTPEQYEVTYTGIGNSQDRDIEEYGREYAATFAVGSRSNAFQIGATDDDLKALITSVTDYAEFVPVDKEKSKHIDEFLAAGWIILGDEFRSYGGERNIPVRIRLKDFSLSKHQRRVLKRNSDIRTEVKSLAITERECALFENFRIRLIGMGTKSLFNAVPEMSSNEIKTFTVTEGDRLVATSYLVIGKTSTYSLFAMWEPAFGSRSLGILTILKEIEFSIIHGKEYYYLGPVHAEPSYYDYKKHFHALESFDGRGNWTNCARFRGQPGQN